MAEFKSDFSSITCCHEDCGIQFFVLKSWEEKKRNDHTWFYCPHGHGLSFPSPSEKERIERDLQTERRRREDVEKRNKALQDFAEQQQRQISAIERSRKALRSAMTRFRNQLKKIEK